MSTTARTPPISRRAWWKKGLRKYAVVYLLLLIPVAVVFIFQYVPILGILMAFKDYKLKEGFWGIFTSPNVGLKHFRAVFASGAFYTALFNTLKLTTLKLLIVFPAPIIFALMLNEIRHKNYKRFVQTISTLPNFFSTITIFGIIQTLLSPSYGLVNMFLQSTGRDSIFFLGRPEWIRPLAVSWDVWQGTGWGAIVYLAVITGIDAELYEAAIIDGTSRFQSMARITLPGLTPAILLMFVFRIAGILDAGFEQMLVLYSTAVHSTAVTLDVFVLLRGVQDISGISFAAAVGLFRSAVTVILVLIANQISKKLGYVAVFD